MYSKTIEDIPNTYNVSSGLIKVYVSSSDSNPAGPTGNNTRRQCRSTANVNIQRGADDLSGIAGNHDLKDMCMYMSEEFNEVPMSRVYSI